MSENSEKTESEPTLVERWLKDQEEWQRSVLAYIDSMVKNDDFLVHLGNAMRGSLLAGKPYPMSGAPAASAPETPADDRLDQILFTLHQIQGQLEDLRMGLDEVRSGAGSGPQPAGAGSSSSAGSSRPRSGAGSGRPRSSAGSSRPRSGAAAPSPRPRSARKTGKRKVKE